MYVYVVLQYHSQTDKDLQKQNIDYTDYRMNLFKRIIWKLNYSLCNCIYLLTYLLMELSAS
jgi:aminoglycoside phosphotransferase family enzyme